MGGRHYRYGLTLAWCGQWSVAWRSTLEYAAWSRYRRDRFRALLEFGRLRGKVAINVADGIPKLYRNGARAEIIWLEDDMARFREACDELGAEHIADGMRSAA